MTSKNLENNTVLYLESSLKFLRQKAEALTLEKFPSSSEDIQNLSAQDIASMLHELHVHQIELEMQNDELRKTHIQLITQKEQYFDLYDLAPIGYCTLDKDGKILQSNRVAASLLGKDKKKLTGHLISDFIMNEDQDIYYLFRKHFLKPCELRLMRENKSYCWVELSASQAQNLDRGDTICLLLSDITERKEIEDERHIAAMAFESQSGMVITDANGTILRVNPAFSKITGYSEEDIIGKRMDVLHSGQHDKLFYARIWKTLTKSHNWQGEIWNKRKNGEVFVSLLTITAVITPQGKVIYYIGNFSDITEYKEAQEVIHKLAYYDPMTKLPNRLLFQERLNQAIIATGRSHLYGAVFFLDLDNFKELNDTQGHDVGDLLLIDVAERLRLNVREGDTVARQGGDEFIILLENLNICEKEAAFLAKQVGDKLLESLNSSFILKEYEYYCKLSIGIELFNKSDNAETLFKHADIALYQAKNSGGNQLVFFDPAMQSALDQRSVMERELKQALELNQFRLYYQPQLNSEQQVIGVEALLRWEHPERGLVAPDNFISLTEETGLILLIGLWVLQTACAQLKVWEADNHTWHLRIAVNVSARQFRQKDFVVIVKNVLKESGANPALLKLELTESLILENVEDTIEKMHTIKRLGIHFSMDDFGTGYSSLSYLAKLPLNQLKIDKSFVKNLPENKNDAMIARTIITMGIGLDMNVIAEGVETQEQFDFLESYGCHAYQGYLFSCPLEIDTLNLYLEKNSKINTNGVNHE